MTSPTPAQFYATSHIGNRFGVKGPFYGPKGHLGQDFNGWAEGTIIPAFLSGEVVTSGWSDNLGWYITVLSVLDNGTQQVLRYVSFCHMQSKGHDLGRINVGDPVGPIGATGKLAAGVHVHIPVAVGKPVGQSDVEDPLPFITHMVAKTTTSGGDSRPLDPPKPKEPDLMSDLLMFHRTSTAQDSRWVLDSSAQGAPILRRLSDAQFPLIQALTQRPPVDYSDPQLLGLLQALGFGNLTVDGPAKSTLGKLDRCPPGGELSKLS